MSKPILQAGLLGLLSFISVNLLAATDFSGYIELEGHFYPQDGITEEQENALYSVAVEPEFKWESESETQSFRFKAFGRYSDPDGNRDHGDIREMYYTYAGSGWQVEAGIDKVFWGVTESLHLVDIINQTDNVESITGEEKLGQPMLALGLEQTWGNLDIYVLPLFRERKFPQGPERFILAVPTTSGVIIPDIDESATAYESDDEEQHVDYAIRWFKSFGSMDLALSYFDGTNRDPLPLVTAVSPTIVVSSYYEQISQTGLALQYLHEDWAWKLEAIHRRANTGNYSAAVAGFEYTLSDLEPWGQDIGILVEYLWNDREDFTFAEGLVPLPVKGDQLSPFEDEVFLGARFSLNDVNSTEFLAGIIVDSSDGTTTASFEGSRRIGDNIRITLNMYIYTNVDEESALYAYEKDDQIEAKIAWYF